MSDLDQEIFRSLPKVHGDRFTELYDVGPEGRKYNRGLTIQVDADMYLLLQALAHHPRLPFQGNMSAMGRHAYASVIESLTAYLEDGGRTTWEGLRRGQQRLTYERYVVSIEDQLDTQVEMLEAWTASKEWAQVARDLETALDTVLSFPEQDRAWRTRAAQGWLKHNGVRRLYNLWEDTMKEESKGSWKRVEAVFGKMREIAGVG